MGVISTYGELKQAIKDYTGRDETTFNNNIVTFVHRAHVTLMRELRIPLLQATANLTINAETVAQPADFRAVVRLFVDSSTDTTIKPTSVENRVRLAVVNDNGRPQFFALEGTNFAFAPIPDATYTGKLLYYKTLSGLSADSDTNALLTRHPFAYLYGALAEWARFDRSDDDIALYEGLFGSELNAIQTAEQIDAMGGGTLEQLPSGAIV